MNILNHSIPTGLSRNSKRKIVLVSFLALFLFLNNFKVTGQTISDTTLRSSAEIDSLRQSEKNLKPHSPTKATIYSMVLPGLGQAYNRKYWKVPLVYAGFGVLYYFIRFNDNLYQQYKDAYYHSLVNVDNTEPPINDLEAKYDSQTLLDAKDYYRRNRDLSYILSGVWYVLNIIDATVDAHLYSWNVDENLSLKIEPQLMTPQFTGFKPSGGLKLTMKF